MIFIYLSPFVFFYFNLVHVSFYLQGWVAHFLDPAKHCSLKNEMQFSESELSIATGGVTHCQTKILSARVNSAVTLSYISYCLSNQISWCIDLIFLLCFNLCYRYKGTWRHAIRICLKHKFLVHKGSLLPLYLFAKVCTTKCTLLSSKSNMFIGTCLTVEESIIPGDLSKVLQGFSVCLTIFYCSYDGEGLYQVCFLKSP